MDKQLLHTKALVVKENVQENGVIDAIVGSTAVLDRMGDIINQEGWDLANFKENPVILWGHNAGFGEDRPPIGKALKVWIEDKGKKTAKLMFKVQMDLQDSFAADIFRKVKEGFINTVSVGFLPTEWKELDPDNWWGGREYIKQELLELSFVPVPANPEAVVTMRSFAQKDKRLTPIEEKDAFPQVKDDRDEKKKAVDMDEMMSKAKEMEDHISEMQTTQKDIVSAIEDEDMKSIADGVKEMQSHTGMMDDLCASMTMMMNDGDKSLQLQARKVLTSIIKSGRVLSAKNEEKIQNAVNSLQEVLSELDATEDEKANKHKVSKKVIPYKDLGKAPESESWDGSGEVAKADVADLKQMCAWYDDEDAENKSAYKLPHHRQEDKKAVWRGVAGAMSALLGARGGVDIPEDERKGVYDHLVKHYEEFDKEAPEFKHVENQTLKGFDEEIHVLTLDREDKHEVRLIKELLKEVKKNNRTQKPKMNDIIAGLKLIDKSVSQLNNNK